MNWNKKIWRTSQIKKFLIRKLIDISEFAWVYEGKNFCKNIPVAIKIENTSKYNLLESEAYILMNIKGFGIPEIITFGKYGSYKILYYLIKIFIIIN